MSGEHLYDLEEHMALPKVTRMRRRATSSDSRRLSLIRPVPPGEKKKVNRRRRRYRHPIRLIDVEAELQREEAEESERARESPGARRGGESSGKSKKGIRKDSAASAGARSQHGREEEKRSSAPG